MTNLGGSVPSSQRKDRLDSNIEAGHIERLEHDLPSILPGLRGSQRALS